jgi:hypothetical protein
MPTPNCWKAKSTDASAFAGTPGTRGGHAAGFLLRAVAAGARGRRMRAEKFAQFSRKRACAPRNPGAVVERLHNGAARRSHASSMRCTQSRCIAIARGRNAASRATASAQAVRCAHVRITTAHAMRRCATRSPRCARASSEHRGKTSRKIVDTRKKRD